MGVSSSNALTFLSTLDEREMPKGSRDPLGFESVWVSLGREIVPNLTTVTNSWRTFATGLLGFYWCDNLAYGSSRDQSVVDAQKFKDTFIRYEQIAAYLRYAGNDKSFLGITRVQKRQTSDNFIIGNDSEARILQDQLTYGIWGLYSVALTRPDGNEEEGLIYRGTRKPTKKGEQILSSILEQIGEDKPFYEWIKPYLINPKEALVSKSEIESKADEFKAALNTIKFELLTYLLDSKNNLLAIMDGVIESKSIKQSAKIENLMPALIEQAGHLNDDLEEKLDRISKVERLLVTCNLLFEYCRTQQGRTLSDVAEDLKSLSFEYLADYADLKEFTQPIAGASHLKNIAKALKGGNLQEAISEILRLNKDVMQNRRGAPWAELEGNKIKVRFKVEKPLSDLDKKLQQQWHYDYFLSSYYQLALELNKAQTELEGTV